MPVDGRPPNAHHPPVLLPGTVVAEKYRIERELGAGGMGAVYEATNLILQKRVALKVMGGAFTAQADAVERFFREAMSASRVRHPAIVEIYDAGWHDGAPWMTMELLDGESLADRLERRGPLSLGEVKQIFPPVLSALDAVHAQGIVHRDLKPDNIFLERLPDGRTQPKLLDFGIAKTEDGLNKLTATGAVMGTAHYLAPEQARDSSTVDPRTDLYALGVVLYEVLSGRMPHPASTLPELISKLITEEPIPLLQVAPGVPPALANVVHWCLARDPAARPQRAGDLAHHLRSALADAPDVEPAGPASRPGGAARSTGTVDPHVGTALAAAAGAPGAHAARGLGGSGGAGPAAPGSVSPAGGGHGGSGSPGSVSPAGGGHGAPGSADPPPAGGWGSASAPGRAPGGAPPPLAYPAPLAAGAGAPPRWEVPGRPRRASGGGKLVFALIAGVLALGACTFIAPLALGLLGVAGSLSAFGGPGGGGGGLLSGSGVRWWESWRMPILIDANGDGHEDVVGWGRTVARADIDERLCAFDGRDGSVLWCESFGEKDDVSEEQTLLLGPRLVHFDARGRAAAIRLRDGERLDWEASVRGRPEEVCVVGTERVAVRTRDHLWSVLTVATGSVALVGEQRPAGCAPADTMEKPRGLDTRVTSPSWQRAERSRELRRLPEMRVRGAFASPDGQHRLAFGRERREGRSAGSIALVRGSEVVWQTVVPNDRIRAQAQPPEALAITDDVVVASYEMTARGRVPRRLAAFRTSDGQRLWDVGLPDAHGRAAWYVRAGSELVVVCTTNVLFVLDRRNGDLRFRLGEVDRG
jgi:serine/threonine-protein kinase